MLNLCTWNVRGLNDPSKLVEVKHLVHTHQVIIIAILETRVKFKKYPSIIRKFGNAWSWEHNYAHCDRGRIWVGWQVASGDS